MTVQYNGVLTQSMRSALSTTLQKNLKSWVKQWFVGGEAKLNIASIEFTERLFSSESVAVDLQDIVCCFDDCMLVFAKGQSDLLAAMTLKLDKANAADVELAEFVNDIVIADLANAIKLGSSDVCEPKEVIESVAKVTFELCGKPLTLYLSSLYLHRFALSQSQQLNKQKFKALSLKQLVSEQQLSMQLSMGSQPVTVAQLMSLKVGHVIPLQQKIKEPLALSAGQGQTQLKGYLVKNQGQKAVYITGIAK